MKLNNIKGISFGKNPDSDWKKIFLAALTLAILTIAVNVYVYVKIDKGEMFVVEGEVEGGGNSLNIEELNATLKYYEGKTENFQRIIRLASSTPVSDPSI